eukprot:6701072-Heterocapsa_arctica.AAC.1
MKIDFGKKEGKDMKIDFGKKEGKNMKIDLGQKEGDVVNPTPSSDVGVEETKGGVLSYSGQREPRGAAGAT